MSRRPNRLRELWREGDAALLRMGLGYSFLTLGSDARLMANGSQQMLKRMRS